MNTSLEDDLRTALHREGANPRLATGEELAELHQRARSKASVTRIGTWGEGARRRSTSAFLVAAVTLPLVAGVGVGTYSLLNQRSTVDVSFAADDTVKKPAAADGATVSVGGHDVTVKGVTFEPGKVLALAGIQMNSKEGFSANLPGHPLLDGSSTSSKLPSVEADAYVDFITGDGTVYRSLWRASDATTTKSLSSVLDGTVLRAAVVDRDKVIYGSPDITAEQWSQLAVGEKPTLLDGALAYDTVKFAEFVVTQAGMQLESPVLTTDERANVLRAVEKTGVAVVVPTTVGGEEALQVKAKVPVAGDVTGQEERVTFSVSTQTGHRVYPDAGDPDYPADAPWNYTVITESLDAVPQKVIDAAAQ